MLPHLIGSVFFQKKKQPIVIDVRNQPSPRPSFFSLQSHAIPQCTKKNLKLQIERAKKCSLLYVAAGSCSMLRFGNSKFSVEKNAENLACAIEQMIKSVPGRHKNIQVCVHCVRCARFVSASNSFVCRHSASRPTILSRFQFSQVCRTGTPLPQLRGLHQGREIK
jgi:hypothetical protein